MSAMNPLSARSHFSPRSWLLVSGDTPGLLRMGRLCAALLLFAALLPAALGDEILPEGLYAEVTTPRGIVLVELHFRQAPMTVANYIGLAEGTLGPGKSAPFYDGLTFHRVVEDFVVQGGDPTGMGDGGPGYEFADEIAPGLRHDRAGVLQMANSGPDTNGSQWCFMLRAVPRLNYLHTVFGHVVRGLEILPQIRQGDTMRVKILRMGPDAEAFLVTRESFAAQADAAKKHTGPSHPGPDAPFDDPDHLLPAQWERARGFTFKLANFERFTGRRLCARVLARTPEGGIDSYLRETAGRLGIGESGALAVYCADNGQWRCRLGDRDRGALAKDVADGESPGGSREVETRFFDAARRSADEATAYAQGRLPAGETLTPPQKLKLRVDAVLDGLILKLEPKAALKQSGS
jgi:cyclophilin family peptidyl-prolyl cis-trans isomerase